jgi:hypothetical protein
MARETRFSRRRIYRVPAARHSYRRAVRRSQVKRTLRAFEALFRI